MWKYFPWMLALIAAPLLGGLTIMEGQAATALLLAASLLLTIDEPSVQSGGGRTILWRGVVLCLVFLPLIPLPMTCVETISPESARLADQFPVEWNRTPSWLPISLSSSASLQRLWEILLMVVSFQLARTAASRRECFPNLALALSIALLLLAASDFIYRLGGRTKILGLWTSGWGEGAGTFANRNHFANWIYVAVVFQIAWMVRTFAPLRSNRPGRSLPSGSPAWMSWFAAGSAALAAVMAIATGSRGGLIAFVAGIAAWAWLLHSRSRSRNTRRWKISGAILGVTGILVLATGDYLIGRLLEMDESWLSRYPKLAIWKDACKLIPLFPWFGVGPGNFYTAFNHYRAIGPNTIFWHVENEFIQLFVEWGILLGLLAIGLAAVWIRRGLIPLLGKKINEPEMLFGAVAACVAFLCHAAFEFVFQIPANGLLFASLLGLIAGCQDQSRGIRSSAPPNRGIRWRRAALASAFLLAAVLNLAAALPWFQARILKNLKSQDAVRQAIENSTRRWPWGEPDRWIRLARLQLRHSDLLPREEQITRIAQAREWLTEGLRREPFNWKLRMERLWLDLAYSPNLERNLAQAENLLALYPLQTEIPIRLAEHYAGDHPEIALRFLEKIDLSKANNQADALRVAWRATEEPSTLWNFTPNTVPGLQTLARFAESQGLNRMAVSAYQRLIGQSDSPSLAAAFLRLRQPGLALSQLMDETEVPREKLLLAQAHYDLGNYTAAIRHAESVVRSSRDGAFGPNFRTEQTPTFPAAYAQWSNDPSNVRHARDAAQAALKADPNPDHASAMRRIAARFPADRTIQWFYYQWLLQQKDYADAADIILRLARTVP